MEQQLCKELPTSETFLPVSLRIGTFHLVYVADIVCEQREEQKLVRKAEM